jgi:phosphoserine phosphatase
MSHATYVTTVIAPHGTKKLNDKILGPLQEQVGAAYMHWLSVREACDLYHDKPVSAPITFDGCDVVTQPTLHRRKKLLVSDMDSTLIEQECIDELADYLGLKDQVAVITERAMNGELEFRSALRERVALLKGLPQQALQEVYNTRITLMPGAKELLATMKAHGAHCLLVSGGFTFFTSRIREVLGFDEDHANELECVDGKLTGRVVEPILDKDSKLASLQQFIRQLRIPVAESMAVGDGANDLPMLQAAGLGIAYHAKPVVREATHAAISHADLRALLYIQGYSDDDMMK